MKIFDTQPKPGMPVRHKMFFNAFLRMARAWEMLKVHNGHVSWSNGMPTIVVDSVASIEGKTDYDHIYVGGRTYTPGARTNKILQINADGTSSWVAAIQNPMPAGCEQYDVDKNEIHLPGETAGNQ